MYFYHHRQFIVQNKNKRKKIANGKREERKLHCQGPVQDQNQDFVFENSMIEVDRAVMCGQSYTRVGLLLKKCN